MAHVGRTREGPVDGFRQVSQFLAIGPTVATIGAFENRRWTGADKQLAALRVLNHAPGFFVKDTIVDLVPALATVFAALHATATRGCVDAARVISVNLHR